MKDFQSLKPGVPIVEGPDMCTKIANVQEVEQIQITRKIERIIINEELKHCKKRHQTRTIPVEKEKTDRQKELAKVKLLRQWLTRS